MRASISRLVTAATVQMAVLIGAALPMCASGQGGVMRSSTDPVPTSYFGLHIHRIAHTQPWYPQGDKITPWPSTKFGSWRLWDAFVAWKHLEPERGKWNFQTLDKYLVLAEKAGVDVVLPLGLSPSWASARPTEPSNYDPGNAAEPRDIEDWRNYVRHVALRYKGRIRSYELWNEVNVKEFYSGSQEKLVQLARVAYKTLKEVDPNIVFVSPSVVGEGHHKWLDQYLTKGGAEYLDVVGYHFYMPKAPPEAMLPVIQEVQNVMRKHGLQEKPLWNTEIGWWIDNKTKKKRLSGVGKSWVMLDDEHAAAYVARTLLVSWPAGVSRVYWYAWDAMGMGLIRVGSLKLAPAAIAYDRIARSLTGGLLKQCRQDTPIWTCELVQGDGKTVWIVWTEDNIARNWSIPENWSLESAETLHGSALSINGSTIRIGMVPVFLLLK